MVRDTQWFRVACLRLDNSVGHWRAQPQNVIRHSARGVNGSAYATRSLPWTTAGHARTVVGRVMDLVANWTSFDM